MSRLICRKSLQNQYLSVQGARRCTLKIPLNPRRLVPYDQIAHVTHAAVSLHFFLGDPRCGVDAGKPQKQAGGEYNLSYSVGGKSVSATIKPSGGDLFDKSIFRRVKAPQNMLK